MFRALALRNYRLYASGQIVSLTGTWMARVTQDWLVYHVLTHDSSFALGVVTAVQFLPTLALGMFGGVIGDRYPKRRVLITTQVIMAVLSLLTGLLVAFHTDPLWSIFLLAFLFGVTSAIDMPVRQAFVVEMVGRDVLQNAVSLNSAIFNSARILGPAVAGIAIETVGLAPAFFFNAVSYLAVIAGLLAMRLADLNLAPVVARARGQLREGLAYVRNRPDLLLPIVLIGFVGTFGLNFQITNALMARGVFHRGAGTYGLLSTAQATGSLVGALFAARRLRRPRPQLLVMSALAFGVLEMASAFVGSFPLFLVLLVPIGASAITLATACNSMVQLGTAPNMQSRTMALYITVFAGGAPIGSLLVGWIGGVLGPRPALLFGGGVSALAAIGCAAVYVRTQHIDLKLRDRLRAGTVQEPTELQDVGSR